MNLQINMKKFCVYKNIHKHKPAGKTGQWYRYGSRLQKWCQKADRIRKGLRGRYQRKLQKWSGGQKSQQQLGYYSMMLNYAVEVIKQPRVWMRACVSGVL